MTAQPIIGVVGAGPMGNGIAQFRAGLPQRQGKTVRRTQFDEPIEIAVKRFPGRRLVDIAPAGMRGRKARWTAEAKEEIA